MYNCNMTTAEGAMFKAGDKVRHWLDVNKGWDMYGIGEVRGYDASLRVYIVYFTNYWNITQYADHDLVKVEA